MLQNAPYSEIAPSDQPRVYRQARVSFFIPDTVPHPRIKLCAMSEMRPLACNTTRSEILQWILIHLLATGITTSASSVTSIPLKDKVAVTYGLVLVVRVLHHSQRAPHSINVGYCSLNVHIAGMRRGKLSRITMRRPGFPGWSRDEANVAP